MFHLLMTANGRGSGDGDLRLADRLDINGYATGAVQVFHDGAWGAVCSNTFDTLAADVACRQMGFISGTLLPLAIDTRFTVDTSELEVLSQTWLAYAVTPAD